MKFSVEMNGQKQLIGALNRLNGTAVLEVREVVRKTANAIRRKARRRLPRKSGKTRRSIRVNYTRDRLSASIGTGYYVARFIEFGTAPHRIKTKTHKALAFELNGETAFAKGVSHPGTAAKPFLFPTFEEEKPEYVPALAAALNRAGRKAAQ